MGAFPYREPLRIEDRRSETSAVSAT